MAPPVSAAANELLDPDFLRKLEQLAVATRRAFAGSTKGEKRSPRRGTSVEFADFRNYVPGDDFRYVDWNVFGRLEKLFLKLFVEEEDLHIYFLLDTSRSMAFGTPSKMAFARRLAAALAYLGLMNLDRVGIAGFNNSLTRLFPATRGRKQVFPVLEFLAALSTDGETNLLTSLTQFARRQQRPGVAFVLSDFLLPGGYEKGLTALLARRYEVHAIQVLSPQELDPDLVGDLKLVDSETGEAKEVTLSESALRHYRRSTSEYCSRLRQFCVSRNVGYVLSRSDTDLSDLVLRQMRQVGMLR